MRNIFLLHFLTITRFSFSLQNNKVRLFGIKINNTVAIYNVKINSNNFLLTLYKREKKFYYYRTILYLFIIIYYTKFSKLASLK